MNKNGDIYAIMPYRVSVGTLSIVTGKVHVSTFGWLSGSEDRGGVAVTTVSSSLVLGGWVTKVLKNSDKN